MRPGRKVRRLQVVRQPRRRHMPPLRKGVYVVPSLFTTGGLFCGFYSIICTLQGRYMLAAILILAAHMCDGLDGRVARLTRSTSAFGIEYDSLADLVAFGVAPGILAYGWALSPWGNWGWLAASLYVACGALRLARFNLQVANIEKRHFVGLPIPAAADLLAATVLLYYYFGGEGATSKHVILLLLVYMLAGLMVSAVRYYSFKELELHRRQPFWLLVGAIVLLKVTIAEPQLVLFVGAALYVASGPVVWMVRVLNFRRRRRERQAALALAAAAGVTGKPAGGPDPRLDIAPGSS